MKLNLSASVQVSDGGISIQWGSALGKSWATFFNFADSGNGNKDGLTPKEVEYACARLAQAINHAMAVDVKLSKNPEAAPMLALNGTDVEKLLAFKYLEGKEE